MSMEIKTPNKPFDKNSAKSIKALQQEYINNLWSVAEDMDNGDYVLPEADMRQILENIKNRRHRSPASSFEEAGCITDDYIGEEVEKGSSVASALVSFKQNNILKTWFPDSYEDYCAHMVNSTLMHNGVTYNPNLPENAVAISPNSDFSCAVPTKEGAILKSDITHFTEKECYLICEIKDENLAKTQNYTQFVKQMLHYKIALTEMVINKNIPKNKFFSKEETEEFFKNRTDLVQKPFGNRYQEGLTNLVLKENKKTINMTQPILNKEKKKKFTK